MKHPLSLFAFLALLAVSPNLWAADVEKLKELHQKAEQQIALNNYKAAMETYQEILFLEPDDETSYANMGLMYLLFSEFTKAKEAFQNALSIDPENETALAGLEKIRDPDGSFYLEKDPDQPSQSMPESSEDSTD